MLDLEQSLRDVPRIAMRMAEIIRSQTVKQIRDKRREPAYIAGREKTLRQAKYLLVQTILAYFSTFLKGCQPHYHIIRQYTKAPPVNSLQQSNSVITATIRHFNFFTYTHIPGRSWAGTCGGSPLAGFPWWGYGAGTSD
ncbi:hypothetical protein L798_14571 [Zootermopsis nevadensis]|uniref:Uncharacterized protein n=1 Tax=Zootermopsis nevadensis TaxID=136037 RepID=A0A067QSE0_ZOONE|nr:hypothetical protein L798_14571 [Zootermopsis nevadensis]